MDGWKNIKQDDAVVLGMITNTWQLYPYMMNSAPMSNRLWSRPRPARYGFDYPLTGDE